MNKEIEDEKLELPSIESMSIEEDVMSIISEGLTSKHEFDKMLIITDFKLDKKCKDTLHCFKRITEFDQKLFQNRGLPFMNENELDCLWVNLAEKGSREWVRKNIIDANKHGFSVILAYNYKNSKWTKSLDKFAEVTLKKKDLANINYLTIGELVDDIKVSTLKISKPISSCLDRLIFKNRLIQDSKN